MPVRRVFQRMTTIRKRSWKTAAGESKVAWLVDYRDNSGKRRFKQFDRKKDADAWRVDTSFDVSRGVHTADSQSITVAEAAQRWMDAAINRGCRRSTLHGYDNLSRLHICPFIGSIKLSALTRPMVVQFRDQLNDAGRSPAMTKKAVRALSLILNEAMEQSLVAQNVVIGVKLSSGKGTSEPIEIPTRKELQALIKACDDKELPLIMTAIFSGLRAGELRGLRWQDIDLINSKLTVSQSADLWNKIGAPKSSAAYRTIPVPASLIKTLKAWKLACPPSELDLAFPNSKGTVFGYQNLLQRVFFPIQVRAGLSRPAMDKSGQPKLDKDGKPELIGKYGFHSLRHAAASGWIEQNVDLKRLQTWLGHANIQISLDTYGHLILDDAKDQAIAASVESLLIG